MLTHFDALLFRNDLFSFMSLHNETRVFYVGTNSNELYYVENVYNYLIVFVEKIFTIVTICHVPTCTI